MGGNRLSYPHDVSTPTKDLTTAKCLINSILSTENSKALCADIKDFYLNTEIDHFEYMIIRAKLIPEEIMEQYNLAPLVDNGWVYTRIRKGMYELPQAGLLASIK